MERDDRTLERRYTCIRNRERNTAGKHPPRYLVFFFFLSGRIFLAVLLSPAQGSVFLRCARGDINQCSCGPTRASHRFLHNFLLLCREPDAVTCGPFCHFSKLSRERRNVLRVHILAENDPCVTSGIVVNPPPLLPLSRALQVESLYTSMVDKGPLLTSAIIFYLSIGAAIFQVLEEPNWKTAAKHYRFEKDKILKEYPCLTKDDLERILEVWT